MTLLRVIGNSHVWGICGREDLRVRATVMARMREALTSSELAAGAQS